MTFKTRLSAAAYLARRLVLKGEAQRFAPSGAPVFDPAVPPEHGLVDGVSGGKVRGWARREEPPFEGVRIDAYLDDIYIGRVAADRVRKDLAGRSGFAPSGRHGYEFALPEEARRLGGRLRLVAAASGLELSGSPLTLAPQPTAVPVEEVRAILATGWCTTAGRGRVTSLPAIEAAYGERLAILAEPDPVAFDATWPVTRAMTHVNVRRFGGGRDFHGSKAYAALLVASGEHFAGTTAGLPMDRRQIEALTRATGRVLGGRVASNMLIDVFADEQEMGAPALGSDDAAADLLTRFVVEVLARARLPLELLGASGLRFLAETLGPSARDLSRFEAALARMPDFASLPIGSPLTATGVRLAAEDLGMRLAPLDVARQPKPLPLEPGVRIIAGDHGDSGLSVNSRHSLAALQRLDGAVELFTAPTASADGWESYALLDAKPFETVLLHTPPDDAVEVILRLPPGQASARLIGFFMWETESVPAAHQLGVRLVDEIWTASRYCRDIFQSAAPTTPIHVVGHAVQLAASEPSFDVRARTGVEPDAFLFLFHFDAHSWISRKNPVGVIRAFRQAFPSEDRGARLLIKVRRAEDAGLSQWNGWWQEFYEEAAADDRICILREEFDAAGMAALVHAADVFVSLHRSEGFGYGPAEAMLAGKPLVTSAYGGVLDFATAETALLVPASRRALRPGEFLYGDAAQVWGEPDIGAAARAMRRLYDDRAFAADLGRRGAARVAQTCSIEALAQRYDQALAEPPARTVRLARA